MWGRITLVNVLFSRIFMPCSHRSGCVGIYKDMNIIPNCKIFHVKIPS